MPSKPSNLRRFFFDDGSSRKRWHVGLTGKTRVVLYGRLTGALKETKKAFASAKEAAADTGKLIASKKRERYREVDPSRLEIARPKGRRPATEPALLALEKRIGSALPDEYRAFLAATNGGRPNPDCVEVPGAPNIANVGVGTLFHLQPSKPGTDELLHEFERLGEVLPPGYLPIAGSSDVFTISLKPATFGCIHWWNHDHGESDDETYPESVGYLLASSFDEFLTRIADLYAEVEEAKPTAAVENGAAKPTKKKGDVRRLFRLFLQRHTPETIAEIKQVVGEVGDMSGIEDGKWPFLDKKGKWPFNNIDDVGLLRCLLDAGLNPKIVDEDGHTLLWQCASSIPCIELLLERGADLEHGFGDYPTPLARAISLQELPAVARLIEAGADPTVKLPVMADNYFARNKPLADLVRKGRERWKGRKKATKKTAKKSSRK